MGFKNFKELQEEGIHNYAKKINCLYLRDVVVKIARQILKQVPFVNIEYLDAYLK